MVRTKTRLKDHSLSFKFKGELQVKIQHQLK